MKKIKIAIIDSGVRLDHPALRGSTGTAGMDMSFSWMPTRVN